MQLKSLEPIRKPRFHLENYEIDLHYIFTSNENESRKPYYTAYIRLIGSPNSQQPNQGILRINGVYHHNIQGCFNYDPYTLEKTWNPNHISIFKKQGFFEHSTDNARATFIENLKELLKNIPETELKEAKLEALQKRVERQKEEVEKAEENLKSQKDTLNQYQQELNEFNKKG